MAKKLAQKHREWYQRYRDDTLDWRESRDKMRKQYHGLQFSSAEGAESEAEEQTTVVYNMIRPLLRKRVAKLIGSKPTGKVFGITEYDQQSVDLLAAMGDYFWDLSKGWVRMHRAISDSQKAGVGYLYLYADSESDYGLGDLKFTNLSYEEVFYDKMAKEVDLSDAPRVIVSKLVDADKFFDDHPNLKRYEQRLLWPYDIPRWEGEGKDREQAEIGLPETFSGPKHYVRIFEVYTKIKRDVIVYREIGIDGDLRIKPDGEELTDQEKEAISNGRAIAYRAKLPAIERAASVSGEIVLEQPEIMPISSYPIIPIINEDTENGEPRGEIDYLHGNQEFLNKSLNLVIMNAAFGSFLRYIVDPTGRAGNMQTFEEFKQQLVTPGGLLLMTAGPNGDFPLKELKPESLNTAFTFLMNVMIQAMQYETNIFPGVLGDTSESPRTYQATLTYGAWAEEILRIPRGYIEEAIEILYNLFYEWCPHYYTKWKRFSVYDELEDRWQQYEINRPEYGSGTLHIANNMSNFRARFRIKAGSTAPSMAWEKSLLYKELAQMNPAFITELLNWLPMRNKERVMKELAIIPQLQDTVKQKDQAIQILQGELARQTQQATEAQKRIEVLKAASAINEAKAQKIAEMENELQKLRDLVKNAKQRRQRK